MSLTATDEWRFHLNDRDRWFVFEPELGMFGKRARLTVFEGETSDNCEPVIGATFSAHDFDEFADRCTRLAKHLRGEL
jgi:hypothetical protein